MVKISLNTKESVLFAGLQKKNMSIITSIRRQTAGLFGRTEHNIALILGIILSCESLYFQKLAFFIPTFLWWIYFISHRIEKKIYGKAGYR